MQIINIVVNGFYKNSYSIVSIVQLLEVLNMKCAYCGKEAKGTKEHIISCAVLDLFPECHLTFDIQRERIHEADPMVKDVCADCNNNKISYIDSYAKNFIETYFTKKYSITDSVTIEYNYTMIQKMLLKYAFNDMRSRKEDCSFFDEDLLSFLMDETNVNSKLNISVLCGLAVNTSPMPDFMTGNLKLRWAKNPPIYSNSTIEHINYETGEISFNKKVELEKFSDLEFSYVFRFNSVQFLLFCWKKESENIEKNNIILQYQYPYALLSDVNPRILLPICTNEMNYHRFEQIHVSWDGFFEVETMRKLASGGRYIFKETADKEWENEEAIIAKEHPRK